MSFPCVLLKGLQCQPSGCKSPERGCGGMIYGARDFSRTRARERDRSRAHTLSVFSIDRPSGAHLRWGVGVE